jgi:NADH-quinone oxidoreductase subunit M
MVTPLPSLSVSESLMPLVLLIPLVAAILVLCGAPARRTSLWAAAANLLLALGLTAAYHKPYAYTMFEVVPGLDLKFLVGLDGLSLTMVLLTVLVTMSAIWVSPEVPKGENAFYACLLFISAGALGAFISFDLFFFYAFHELALIPTFLLIGIWGHGEHRVAAAWKITIYLAAGSFILLLGLIGLYGSLPAGARTFDLTKIQHLATLPDQLGLPSQINPAAQIWIFPLLLVGFGTLVSLFPFHTWAPTAYAAAPTPAAMLHAGVLKKFGLYGMLRIAVPLLPVGMQHWMNVLLILLVGNIIYVGFVTIAQKRLDLMLGYSSVMHMGYIFLGISSLNVIGLSGAAIMMFAHGLSIAVLFAVAGEIRSRTGTMRMHELGGLASALPYLSIVFGVAMFAAIGLPGFANFASEIMVFFGAFAYQETSLRHLGYHQIATICALWGVVMSAVYMLRAYRQIFLGERRVLAVAATAEHAHKPAELPHYHDLSVSRRWALYLLLAGLVVVGFRPRTLLNLVRPVMTQLTETGAGAAQAAAATAGPALAQGPQAAAEAP